jgi:hypothetical protein
MSAALDLGPAEPGRFSLCKKCASKQASSWRLGPLKSSLGSDLFSKYTRALTFFGKQESSWRLGPAEAVMGAPKLCSICVGESGGGGGKGKGGAVLNPKTVACSGCPRRLSFSPVQKFFSIVTLCIVHALGH